MDERRTPQSPRKAVNLTVKLSHRGVDEFVEQYATNISVGGLFIRTRDPKPMGTLVHFKVEIAQGRRVMQGTATVKWTRGPNDRNGPPGMGLEFNKLDEASHALVKRMLAGQSPAGPSVAPPAIAPTVPPAMPAVRRAAPPAPPSDFELQPDDEPLDLAVAAPEPASGFELDVPALALDKAIDFDLDTLLAETPEPQAQTSPPRAADEGYELEVELPSEPAPQLPVDADLSEAAGGVDIDFSLDDEVATIPPPAAPPALPPAPLPEIRKAQPAPVAQGQRPQVLTEAPRQVVAPARPAPGTPVFLKPPASIDPRGLVIGIDLGTSNSCCAVLSNGKPKILGSKDGYNVIPSVVALNRQGGLLVGNRAKSQLLLNPTQSVYGAKRLVGRDFDSATVQQVRERFHYQIVAGPDGKAAVALGPHVLALEEIQGIILQECKEMAETQLGGKVTRAVITCPAYYSEQQREAVRRAAAMAGLKAERIINEPTAAAIAYGLNRGFARKVMVYDLGGGTFDATVLRIDENVFEVLATGGDIFLGGLDFDNQIVDALLGRFEKQHGTPFTGDAIALSRIADEAERAKIALSERTSVDVRLPMLQMTAQGQPLDLITTLTREELNYLCVELVDRTIDVVNDVLLDAKLKLGELDDIILVGGMSRMPLVRDRIKTLSGKPPKASVNADEAVALGAALYSGTVDKVSNVVLIDVVPMTIGIGLPGGGFRRIIERNTALPAVTSFGLTTTRDFEDHLELNVFQGEDSQVLGNEYIGTVRIDDLPKGPKGSVQVAISVKLDAECVLQVEAREMRTRAMVKVTMATRYTPEQIRSRLGIATQPASPQQNQRAQELEKRGGKFWSFLKRVVGRA